MFELGIKSHRPLREIVYEELKMQILRGTQMAAEYEQDPFPIMTLEEYCSLICDCLRILPDEIVVHRLTGDGPKSLLLAPAWSADKKRVLNTMRKAISEL